MNISNPDRGGSVSYEIKPVTRYLVQSSDADVLKTICEIDSEEVAQQIIKVFEEAARIYAESK